MRCLDHIDGVERGPLAPPEPISAAALLQGELQETIGEAVVTRVLVSERHARAQAALGRAIRDLTQVKAREAAFIPQVTRSAAAAQARREFLEGVFKFPSDWRGAEFARMERDAATMAQPGLGGSIVARAQALARKTETAEAEYGRALVASIQAGERQAVEPAGSQATIVAAAQAASELARRTAPAPAAEIARDPAWGFGSIGDGVWIAALALAGGLSLLFAAGAALTGARVSNRTETVHCDVHNKDFIVDMLVSDDTPYEVTRCAAFNGGPVTCGKDCLKRPMARAA